jgi:hypothetical protein
MDFLLGDWAVRDARGLLMGHSRFESRVHGCALVEHWRGVRGGQGTGLMFFDPGRDAWVRVFVGPGFIENGFLGKVVSDGVEFEGTVPEGARLLRMRVRYVRDASGPRILDQESADGGAAWSAVITKSMQRMDSPPGFELTPKPGGVCEAAEYRQFDFWLGRWRVTANGKEAGTNEIHGASRGCLLIEMWSGAGGMEGLSFNYYDPGGKQWRQWWVAPGTLLSLAGGVEGQAMRLAQGAGDRREEIVWTPSADSSITQRWRTSTDGGRTWRITFEGAYQKAPRP